MGSKVLVLVQYHRAGKMLSHKMQAQAHARLVACGEHWVSIHQQSYAVPAGLLALARHQPELPWLARYVLLLLKIHPTCLTSTLDLAGTSLNLQGSCFHHQR